MNSSKTRHIAVVIYTHPELYPPLLNAIDELADIFDRVSVLSRNLKPKDWQYPPLVQIFTSGKLIAVKDSEKKSYIWKVISFLKFTYQLFHILKRDQPEWVMCNDPISLLAFRLVRPFTRRKIRLWYQNHDVAELNGVRTFSIGYFAIRSESRTFRNIELFTLPSESRLKYFPLDGWRGKYFVVPNYPSKRRMQTGVHTESPTGGILKLIYQGRISNEHGLEEIIQYLHIDKKLLLTIIGPGEKEYISSLRDLIKELDVEDRVRLLEPVDYRNLWKITGTHDVGLAINKPLNIIYSTGAQSSNKIYEYAALGLPILYYNDPHYKEYLNRYSWAFQTDLSATALQSIFTNIKANYSQLSKEATSDFENNLNFGCAFKPVYLFLRNPINA